MGVPLFLMGTLPVLQLAVTVLMERGWRPRIQQPWEQTPVELVRIGTLRGHGKLGLETSNLSRIQLELSELV